MKHCKSKAVHDLISGMTTYIIVPGAINDEKPLTCNIAYFLVAPPENAKQFTFGCIVGINPTVWPLIKTVHGMCLAASSAKLKPKSFGQAEDDSYVLFTVLIFRLMAPSYGMRRPTLN